MSDIQQLEQEILQDAQNKANEILKDAKKEAELIHQQANKKRKELMEKLDREIIQEQETEIQRELSRIRIRNKIQIENIKESLIQEIINNSMDQIQKMRETKDQKYLSALTNLIITSGKVLEGGDLTVALHSDDITSVDKSYLEAEITRQSGNETHIELSSPKNSTIKGGTMLYKGSLAVDNTFEAIFDRRKEIIRNELNSLIFNVES
jgi:vacuolar-type H+-ATPase subunit E/Vma4